MFVRTYGSTVISQSKNILVHGNELYGTKGEIASPLYPNSFIDTEDIVWRITVDVQSVIMIKFKDFAVDSYSGDDCYLLGLDVRYCGYYSQVDANDKTVMSY